MAALQKDHLPICIEKLRIALRTMAATEGEPMILRRAKVSANVLREISIFIEEDTPMKSARTEPSPRCMGGTLTAPPPSCAALYGSTRTRTRPH
jgi:pyruvate-formate lyase